MENRRNVVPRPEEEVANARAPPHNEQVPPLEEDANAEQAPNNNPPMKEADMRDILAQITQDMTTQPQAPTDQIQAMTAKDNRDIPSLPHQQVTTMAFRLRDFTRMNPPTLYGSKVDEDPQEFIDEVYKIL